MAVNDYVSARAEVLRLSGHPVLDVGCGDGRMVRRLHGLLSEPVYGHDLPRIEPRCRANMTPFFSRELFEQRFSFAPPEDGLPHPSGFFGLLVSNQVVEHVRDLDLFFGECARVLHPEGRMLCVFPPKSHLIEAHTGVPFLHRLPPGAPRRAALRASHRVLGVPRRRGDEDVGEFWDAWLVRNTFYRSITRVEQIASRYFTRVEDDGSAYAASIVGEGSASWIPGLSGLLRRCLNCCLILGRPREKSPAGASSP